MLFLSNCKGHNERVKTPAEIAREKLVAGSPWTLQTAKVDGVDKTSLYQGLTITFMSNSYTSTHGGVIWPASGTWDFTDESGTTMVRISDGLEISIETLTETQLVISFAWSQGTVGSGRSQSVSGQHTLTFGS